MNYSFEYIDIILLAMIAGFIFLRLRGILGKRTGFEGKPTSQFEKVLNNIQVEKYNLLIIPGGAKAMEYLRQEDIILKKIREFNDKNILIGSICHGAQLLISAKIVNGKKISGYYSIKDDINNAGGIFHEGPAIDDNNIVSSPHYKYLGDWMKLILSKFE